MLPSTDTQKGFLIDVADAERHTPVPAPPSTTDPNDPAVAAFNAAVKARGFAVSQVISKWLAHAPDVLLQELLSQPADQMPIFKPAIGPVIVMRHPHVITCLERTDLFTVDPYAPEMARSTDDKAKNPAALTHYLLGTDRDELYRLDDVILRRVVSRDDEQRLSELTRREAEYWTRSARDSGDGQIDVVTTLAKFVPLRIVTDYLGVPYAGRGEPAALPGLRGGDRFALSENLQKVFTFSRITEGLVPTADDLFGWIKDVFRNSFNNFNQAHPLFGQFRERGIVATEHLTAYVHALLELYKERWQRGDAVPDTMLTRLLRLQSAVTADGAAIEQELAAMLGAPLPPGELARRLSDSMIRSNVFGTVVGAVINPQEATARIVDCMLRLKDGEIEALNGSTYEQAARLARIDEGQPEYARSLQLLRKYALEALRLKPQGEVLLRLCVQDNAELGGTPIRKGTPVFVGYAAAMRDPQVVPAPGAFDITRDERGVQYLGDKERAREAPQSQLYLQHGFGRHKCLGRYASEITMRESLRALLRLGQLERRGPLELDDQRLYAVSLPVGFR